MRLLVATDAHIFETPDGKKWCKSIYGYNFWERYLEVFDCVRVVARCKKIDNTLGLVRVDGLNVEVYGVPFYQGPKQLLKVYLRTKKMMKKAYDGCDAALYRLPSQTAFMAYKAKPKKMKFAGEIVYDPVCDYVNDRGFLKILDSIICKKLRKFCLKADCISYVTKHEIQKNFPAKITTSNRFETYYSTITLSDSVFTGPITIDSFQDGVVLGLSDVAMNSERKGERVLIDVISRLVEKGYNAKAIIIGDGSMRKEFEKYSIQKNVRDRILFTGLLANSNEVMKYLKKCNIFFFPTSGEGLPRGILEAMAIGLPVLSSPIGGIVEIVDSKYLFDFKDYVGFSDKIIELMNNKEELVKMSNDNFSKSLEYKNDILQTKRNELYSFLRKLVILK